ncbi:hypothetical protein C8Q74DRAFT_1242612 [Fomes fomentarius]|nr:hypothetical protein C8Q74DRAFT_1242612 [Fomes fomentarius]
MLALRHDVLSWAQPEPTTVFLAVFLAIMTTVMTYYAISPMIYMCHSLLQSRISRPFSKSKCHLQPDQPLHVSPSPESARKRPSHDMPGVPGHSHKVEGRSPALPDEPEGVPSEQLDYPIEGVESGEETDRVEPLPHAGSSDSGPTEDATLSPDTTILDSQPFEPLPTADSNTPIEPQDKSLADLRSSTQGNVSFDSHADYSVPVLTVDSSSALPHAASEDTLGVVPNDADRIYVEHTVMAGTSSTALTVDGCNAEQTHSQTASRSEGAPVDVDEHQSSPPPSPASLPSDSHTTAEASASVCETAASHEDEEGEEYTPAHIMQSALLVQDENYVPEPPMDDDAEGEWTSVEHTDSQTPRATTPVNDLSADSPQCPAVSSSKVAAERPSVPDDLVFSAILLSESEYLALPSSSGKPESLTNTDGNADAEETKSAEEHSTPSTKRVPAALDLTKDEAYHSFSSSSPPHTPGSGEVRTRVHTPDRPDWAVAPKLEEHKMRRHSFESPDWAVAPEGSVAAPGAKRKGKKGEESRGSAEKATRRTARRGRHSR